MIDDDRSRERNDAAANDAPGRVPPAVDPSAYRRTALRYLGKFLRWVGAQ